MPCLRHRSAVFIPASCSFRIAMICFSVFLLRFILWSFLKARLQFPLDKFKGATSAILLAYRHGLKAQELCQLRWAQVDLRHGRLHVNRAKGGIESVHPLHGPELRALRPLQGQSPYVFVTEAGTPRSEEHT